MSLPLISVVLPVYNEGENIVECLRRLARALDGVAHEILVCYDFDEDSTLPAIRAMPDCPATVKLTKNTLGRGAPNALRTGFRAAQGDVVVTTMADLSDPPEVILEMAREIRAGKAVVSGSRYMPGGSQSGGPWIKRTMSRVAGRLLYDFAGVGTRDATTNFRAYDPRFLQSVEIESQRGFEIALELTIKAHLRGLPVSEVPSSWTDRSAGQSNFKLWKWLPHYLHWFLIAMRIPFCVFAWGALLLGWAWWTAEHPSERPALVLLSLTCLAALLFARERRGRTTWIDLAQPSLWLLPALFSQPSPLWLGISVPSLLLIWLTTRTGPAPPRPPGSTSIGLLGLALFASATLLSQMVLPIAVADEGLDIGWCAALAHFWNAGAQAGVDWCFTAGPWSALSAPIFDPELYWWKVVLWELGWRLGTVLFFVLALLRLETGLERACLVFALILPSVAIDAWTNGFFLAAVLVLGTSKRTYLGLDALAWLLIAAAAMTKFTLLLGGSLCVAAIVSLRWEQHGGREALRFAYGCASAYLLFWFGSGQGLSNALPYLLSSLEISSAYSSAMSSTLLDPRALYLGSACALGMMLCIALGQRLERRAPRFATLCLAALVFLNFKSGFTRAADHPPFFFSFVAISSLLIVPPLEARVARIAAARILRTGLSLVGIFGLYASDPRMSELNGFVEDCSASASRIYQNRLRLAGLEELYQEQLAGEREARQRLGLPKLSARIGAASVDMLGQRQGLLCLLDWNWKPRPYFQSYAANTPAQLQANAQYLASEHGPRYLLAYHDPIDGRWPASEDGLAMLVMSTHFQAVEMEREYMLLERLPSPRNYEKHLVYEQQFEWNQTYALPAAGAHARLFQMEIEPTLLGRLGTFAWQLPPIEAHVQLEDGTRRVWRVIPDLLREPLLFDPAPSYPEDWLRWMGGASLPRITHLQLKEPLGTSGWVQPKVRFRLWEAPGLQPAPDASFLAKAGESMVFIPDPSSILGDETHARITVENSPACLVHAASRVSFELGPGRWSLQGSYGMLQPEGEPSVSDGAEFLILLRSKEESGPRLLHRHSLDPRILAGDRGPQTLDTSFELTSSGTLLLVTLPGKAQNSVQDWCYWRAIRIVPQP